MVASPNGGAGSASRVAENTGIGALSLEDGQDDGVSAGWIGLVERMKMRHGMRMLYVDGVCQGVSPRPSAPTGRPSSPPKPSVSASLACRPSVARNPDASITVAVRPRQAAGSEPASRPVAPWTSCTETSGPLVQSRPESSHATSPSLGLRLTSR